MRPRSAPRVRDERGFTLLELVVASALTLVVLIMGYQILNTTTSTAAAVGNRAQNSTAARLVIDSLEDNLRYADAVWVCGPGATVLTPCPAPIVGTATTLTVQNATGSSNVGQAACTQWAVTSGNLTMTTIQATSVVATGVSVYASTTGFSQPLARLVQVDLQVNQEKRPIAADTVTLHDLIAPDNLTTTQVAASATPCTA